MRRIAIKILCALSSLLCILCSASWLLSRFGEPYVWWRSAARTVERHFFSDGSSEERLRWPLSWHCSWHATPKGLRLELRRDEGNPGIFPADKDEEKRIGGRIGFTWGGPTHWGYPHFDFHFDKELRWRAWGFLLLGDEYHQANSWHRGWYRMLIVPYWFAVGLFAILPVGRIVVRTRNRRRAASRIANGLCLKCGYDLRASHGRCPECNTPIPANLARKPIT